MVDKESLLKTKDFLLRINEIDMPIQDKIEIIKNISLFVEPENYERNVQTLAEKFNEELRWKNK